MIQQIMGNVFSPHRKNAARERKRVVSKSQNRTSPPIRDFHFSRDVSERTREPPIYIASRCTRYTRREKNQTRVHANRSA